MARQEKSEEAGDEPSLEDINRKIALLRRQQIALQARDSLMAFTKFTMPDATDIENPEASRYENARHHDAIARAVEEVVKGGYQFLILTTPPRHGKALALDTPIPTPLGWTRMGELRAGDAVFGADGRPCRVVAVSPVWRERECFRVTTGSAGDEMVADAEHEWAVRTCRKRPECVKLHTTKWLAKERKDQRGYQTARAKPLQLPDAELPVPPYTLGVWLGDGCSGHATVTAHDDDAPFIREGIEAEGVRCSERTTSQTFGLLGVWPALKAMGLPRNKHVPTKYLRSSESQRRALLQGLIDTDGHVAPDGQVEFCSTEERLADAVKELVASLGGKASKTTGRATMNGADFGPKWRVLFYLAGAARMPRKAVRCRNAVRTAEHYLRAEAAPTCDTVCIEVDSPDHMFLAGKGMVPTHNSELVSRRLPAWFLGRHPEQNVVVATYNDDFAMDFGSDVRAIMTSPQYRQIFPEMQGAVARNRYGEKSSPLAKGGAAKNRLQTTKGGMATFVGVGGSLTGRGAHLLIIDDLIKSYEEARSQAFRDRAWDWFTKVAMTRRMGKKLVIITFTRWHPDDIIGRLTDPENEHYNRTLAEKIKLIDLPAIAGEDDPLGREEGEPLWPDWYGREFLEEQRQLDPLGFEALYQQRPSVADGVLFRREHIQYYGPDEPVKTPDLDDLRIYCASDHAVSTAQRADRTCLLKVGIDKQSNIFILDAWWKKATTDAVVEAMLTMGGANPRPLVWWAEKGHISKSIGPFLRKRMNETNTFFAVSEVTPAGDKEQRAQAISARMAMGKVYWPRNKAWTEKAIAECLAFPNGLHDDFVDAFAYIGLGLTGMFPVSGKARQAQTEPRFGTLGWVKAAQRREDREKRLAATGGF